MTTQSLNILQIKEKAIDGVKISSVAFFVIKVFALTRQVILARLLTPQDFGLMAFCLVTIGFLANLINFRIHEAVIQAKENEKNILSSGFTFHFFMALVLIALILFFSQKISILLNKPQMVIYLRVLSLRVLVPVFILPQTLLYRKLDYKFIKIPEIIESIVNSLVSISLAIAGFGIWSLIWGLMAGWISSVIIILVLAKGFPKFCFNILLLKRILKFGWPLYLGFFVNWIFWNADDFMVGSLLGDKSLGYYWIAFYLAHHLIDLRYILSKISFPVFAKLKDAKVELTQSFIEFSKVTAFIFFLIAALFIPLAHPTLTFIFGPKWIPAMVPFMIFIALVSLRAVFAYGGELLISVAKTKYALLFSIIQVSVLLIFGPFAALRFGIKGMAVVILLAMSLNWILLVNYVKRIIDINYIKVLRKAIFIAFIVAGAAFLLKIFIFNLITLILVMFVCSLLYVSLFMLLEKLFMKRLKSYFFIMIKA